MPMIVPTPEEVSHMPPHKRRAARRAVANIITRMDDFIDVQAAQAKADYEWGEAVRAEARRLEAESVDAARHHLAAQIVRDPDDVTRRRRLVLMEAGR